MPDGVGLGIAMKQEQRRPPATGHAVDLHAIGAREDKRTEGGEKVRVLDGAFANFTGTVDDVKMDKQKLKVKVSIFGRPTSVELDFAAVEKR